jgi:hypothetical protein
MGYPRLSAILIVLALLWACIPTTSARPIFRRTSTAIDTDRDGTSELSADGTDALEFDLDDDGVVDFRIIKDTVVEAYDCMGKPVNAAYNITGTNTAVQPNGRRIGVCEGKTGAVGGNDSIIGFGGSANTTVEYGDEDLYRQVRMAVAGMEATEFRLVAGLVISDANLDQLTIDRGAYFLCAPADDVDGNAAAGSANDLNWWVVVQNDDTDDTGVICTDLTGVQCDNYTAVNTTAWNTEVSCDGGAESEWADLRIDINAAGTSYDFYVNDTLEVTVTTNIPADDYYGAVVWIETNEAVLKRVHIDYIEVTHGW